jgi:molecular chaperone DnaJ
VRGSSEVSVKVPPGVATGNYMSIDGMGNVAPGQGEPGDLLVVFEEKEHEHFTRHGDNIICEVPVSFTTAALGGEVTVPGLEGEQTVKISSGTQPGKVIKLRGKGLPHVNAHGRGDQLVQVVVWVPTKLSSEDKELLRKLDASPSVKPPEANRSFFQKLRETLGV